MLERVNYYWCPLISPPTVSIRGDFRSRRLPSCRPSEAVHVHADAVSARARRAALPSILRSMMVSDDSGVAPRRSSRSRGDVPPPPTRSATARVLRRGSTSAAPVSAQWEALMASDDGSEILHEARGSGSGAMGLSTSTLPPRKRLRAAGGSDGDVGGGAARDAGRGAKHATFDVKDGHGSARGDGGAMHEMDAGRHDDDGGGVPPRVVGGECDEGGGENGGESKGEGEGKGEDGARWCSARMAGEPSTAREPSPAVPLTHDVELGVQPARAHAGEERRERTLCGRGYAPVAPPVWPRSSGSLRVFLTFFHPW